MTSLYSDNEPSDEFTTLYKGIASDLQKSGQLLRQLQTAANSPNESATTLIQKFKEVESLVKDVAERTKRLRNVQAPVGRQERAKMDRQRLQDNLLEVLTQLKDVDKQMSVEMRKRNESERQRLGSLQNRGTDLVNVKGTSVVDDQSNPFGDSMRTETGVLIDPLHQVQLQQEEAEYQESLQAIQERDSAMRELEEGVTQVNEIFKDMAQLIHDQGDVIDNIETQIDKAESSARHGNQNLDSAVKYQKRGNRTKIILFAVLGAIAFFIILIVIFKFKN